MQSIIHPEYNYRIYKFDIALLKLSRPIDFFRRHLKVRCVCEPEPLDQLSTSACVALGWGTTNPNPDTKPKRRGTPNLNEAVLPLLPGTLCDLG